MNPYEWRIEEIERNAKRAVDSLWKLDALSGRVDSLESALRESRSEADGLRSELQTCQETLRRLEEQMVEMANARTELPPPDTDGSLQPKRPKNL